MGQNAIYYKGKSYSSGGGGSEVIANPEDTATDTLTKLSVDGDVYEIKSYREITKAEWEALPSSKLSDDILYCITDGGATEPGEYYNPVIYSTTEREIGVWTDGKPLYQKTWSGLNVTPSYNSWTNIIPNNANIETLVRWQALSNGDYKNIDGTGIEWQVLSDYIRAEYNQNANVRTIEILTLQYTKTTDVAGSGEYNTLAIPNVHYSTDEQVIGTWIDGKPLYQKSFIISPLTINTTKTALPSSILTELSDIDTCIGGFCVRHKSEGVTSNATPLSVWIDGSTMYVYSIVQCSNMTHFTFQYTKTTD